MILNRTYTKKTEFTRMCIGEAIISLMSHTPFSKLTVSSIVKKAGVARMSFYKYYNTPKDALTDYMEIVISGYLEESQEKHGDSTYMEEEHVRLALEYFDRYADFFLALYRAGKYSIMIEGVNRFMKENLQTEKQLSVYELYSYAGGLLNTFLQWEINGKTDSAAEVARILSRRYRIEEGDQNR